MSVKRLAIVKKLNSYGNKNKRNLLKRKRKHNLIVIKLRITKRDFYRKLKKELKKIAEAYLMYNMPKDAIQADYPTRAAISMLQFSLYHELIDEGDYLIDDAIAQFNLEQEEKT